MAVSRIALWRLMSVIFGIKCVLLMITLGFLMKNSFTIQSIQQVTSPASIVEFQEDFQSTHIPKQAAVLLIVQAYIFLLIPVKVKTNLSVSN